MKKVIAVIVLLILGSACLICASGEKETPEIRPFDLGQIVGQRLLIYQLRTFVLPQCETMIQVDSALTEIEEKLNTLEK